VPPPTAARERQQSIDTQTATCPNHRQPAVRRPLKFECKIDAAASNRLKIDPEFDSHESALL
jgi:hypothetical protein